MKSAIEEIYYGKLHSDKKPSEKYLKKLREINDICDELKKTLSAKQKTLFEEIIELSEGLDSEAVLNNFKFGFETGLKVGMEIALK